MLNIAKHWAQSKASFLSYTVLLVAGILVLSSCNSESTNRDAEYNLIYLASIQKMEVGENVTIEPLILTNGSKLEPFYRYCRAANGNKHWSTSIKPDEIGNDTGRIKYYCNNQSHKLSGRTLYAFNNNGDTIGLTDVTFKTRTVSYSGARDSVPPIFPHSGTGEVRSITVNRKGNSNINNGEMAVPNYFLVSTNKNRLTKLLGSNKVSVTNDKLSKRVKNLKKYKRRIRYFYMLDGGYNSENGIPLLADPIEFKPQLKKVLLLTEVRQDVNGDRTQDAVVGLIEAPRKSDGKSGWGGIGILYGNGEAIVYGAPGSHRNKVWHSSIPSALLHLNDCVYVVQSGANKTNNQFNFIPLTNSNKSCAYMQTFKGLEDVDNLYLPK